MLNAELVIATRMSLFNYYYYYYFVFLAIGCRNNFTIPLNGKVEIHTPDYPSNYGNYEECRWFIHGTPGRTMAVQFMDFITENRYDKLKIGTGDNIFDEGTVQVEASGNVLPTGFDTPSNLLWVTFFSDGEKTERGFSNK